MSALSPTEKKFEEHVEKHLNSLDYSSKNFNKYDRNLCLIKQLLIEFIKTTQPEKWEQLNKIYGLDTENKILSRISSKISSVSPTHHVVQYLTGSYRNLSTSFMSWHEWRLRTPAD